MQQVLNGAQAHMACPTVICRYLFIAWINLLQKPPRSDLIRNGTDRVGRPGKLRGNETENVFLSWLGWLY